MTTYPLSEPATIHLSDGAAGGESVNGQGTLAECADVVAAMSADMRKRVSIHMDDLGLRFDADEVAELIRFLDDESAGLSNNDIAEVRKLAP